MNLHDTSPTPEPGTPETSPAPVESSVTEHLLEIRPTAAASHIGGRNAGLPPGFRDHFLERRFRNEGEVNLDRLTSDKCIAVLSKAVHIDELYRVSRPLHDIQPGVYRIRSSGSERPLLTLKRHGDGSSVLSETIDIIDPDDQTLERIRKDGQLLAVIEKYRQTYHSKNHPQCLLHLDSIPGLGDFYDVKADKPEHIERFIHEIGLSRSRPLHSTYLEMKQERGISEFQLHVWKFQQKFSDYILGVVSGTLTPLGFLTTTIAGGGSKPAMIVALLCVGLCDGMSDAVAAGAATQSDSKSKGFEQFSMFAKTIAGKILIPCSFIPIVLASESAFATAVYSSLWAGTLLAATASIQAIAHERPVLPAAGRLLGFGAAAVAIGTGIGKILQPVLERWLGM